MSLHVGSIGTGPVVQARDQIRKNVNVGQNLDKNGWNLDKIGQNLHKKRQNLSKVSKICEI